jgi:hypothetical protein
LAGVGSFIGEVVAVHTFLKSKKKKKADVASALPDSDL